MMSGAIAQLGERLLCKQEVGGSIPPGSISELPVKRVLCGGDLAVAEAERLRVGEEVHQLAAFDPLLGRLPVLRLEQVGVVREEEAAHRPGR